MREGFASYYRQTEDQLSKMWDTCLFVLDANVLLDLYRYSRDTRAEFLELLRRVSDRLWVPHQVALEYHRNRPNVICEQVASFRTVGQILAKEMRKPVEDALKSELRYRKQALQSLLGAVKTAFDDINKEIGQYEQECAQWLLDDPVRDGITQLLQARVGSPYSSNELEDIYTRGKLRYGHEIPPGFLDADKGGVGQYGDLVLWYQIIEKAKVVQRPVILVTSDQKQDWYWRHGDDLLPRPELRDEVVTKAGVGFHMYTSTEFMKRQSEYLAPEREIPEEAIQEAEEVQRAKVRRRTYSALPSSALLYPGFRQLGEAVRVQVADAFRDLAPIARAFQDQLEAAGAFAKVVRDYQIAQEQLARSMRVSLLGLYYGTSSGEGQEPQQSHQATTSGVSMEYLPSEAVTAAEAPEADESHEQADE